MSFRFADGMTYKRMEYLKARNSGLVALSESEKPRLVKACKCPTNQKITPKAPAPVFYPKNKSDLEFIPKYSEITYPAHPDKAVSAFTVVQFREWSDEYRIRTRTETPIQNPPHAEGNRETLNLTHRAARKLAESCEYMAEKHGGYSTFLTLTFTDEQRERISAGEVTIQKEVSRFFDAMQKVFVRDGWVDKQGVDYIGRDGVTKKGLCYCWVVEIPKNEAGEDNPHCHVLLKWRVPFGEFESWAKRLESLWGMGFAHLEKIKDGAAAGAYMAKAAGYMCKAAGQDDQGRVRGNRYNISAAARAPEWVTIDEHAMHAMGLIIAEVSEHLTMKYKADYQARKDLNAARDRIRTSNLIPEERKKSALNSIGETLAGVRKKIKAIPVRANKYQIVIKGVQVFNYFKAWATGSQLLEPRSIEFLPEKPAVNWQPDAGTDNRNGKPQSLYRKELAKAFFLQKRLRQAWADLGELADRTEQIIEHRVEALSAWQFYESMQMEI